MEEWTVIIRNAIALAVVITGIVLLMFLTFIGINAANRGGERLSESVGTLDSRTFETYSQTTVSGTTALAAARNFKNTSIGVIIITGNSGAGGTDYFANYCARFNALAASGTVTVPAVSSNVRWAVNTAGDTVTINDGLAVNPDNQNNNLRDATTKISNWYINPSARFRSCIITNLNGEAIGILLVQTTSARAASVP
jgi:hypothetical protein